MKTAQQGFFDMKIAQRIIGPQTGQLQPRAEFGPQAENDSNGPYVTECCKWAQESMGPEKAER